MCQEHLADYQKPPSPADEQENADVIEEIEPEIVRGVIKDVSESGVGLYSDFEFQLEDGMFFDIPSPYGMLHCRAEVVRRDELRATNHKFNFYYGCEMTMTDRKLMKYIYDIQRDILKKTRGSSILSFFWDSNLIRCNGIRCLQCRFGTATTFCKRREGIKYNAWQNNII